MHVKTHPEAKTTALHMGVKMHWQAAVHTHPYTHRATGQEYVAEGISIPSVWKDLETRGHVPLISFSQETYLK